MFQGQIDINLGDINICERKFVFLMDPLGIINQ